MGVPKLQSIKFGEFRINGRLIEKDKDIILFWDRFYTKPKSHYIDPETVHKILLREPELFLVGIGFNNKVCVSEDVLNIIKKQGVEIEILSSAAAVKRYKDVVHRGKRVVAIIHTTC